MDIQQKINECKTLAELCDTLNSYDEPEYDGEINHRLGDECDLCDLPTFGDNEPTDTMEIFSWDDKNILISGNEWTIEPRCKICGEATFSCEHE